MCCGESVQRRTVREFLSQVFLEGRAHPLDPFSATTPGPHSGRRAAQTPSSSPQDFRPSKDLTVPLPPPPPISDLGPNAEPAVAPWRRGP